MSLDPKAMMSASERFNRQNQKRTAELARRSESLSAVFPRLSEIDSEMRLTGINAARAALSSTPEQVQEAIAHLKERNRLLQAERSDILRNAGYPADYLYAGPACSLCGDTGYADGHMCSCLRKLYLEEQTVLLEQVVGSPLPDFEHFITDAGPGRDGTGNRNAVKENAESFADTFSEPGKGLVIKGEPGTGKTYLAACIASRLLKAGYSAVFETAGMLFSVYADDQFRHSEEAAREIRRYETCDLLVLDDLGTESPNSCNSSYLFRLLNTRGNAGKKTVLCTSLQDENNSGRIRGDSLLDRYSAQVMSRVREYYRLTVKGPDMRAPFRR